MIYGIEYSTLAQTSHVTKEGKYNLSDYEKAFSDTW